MVMMRVCVPRLDYPGVGPEHSFLKDVGRAEYFSVTDDEALEGKKKILRISSVLVI
jgi:tryptophan synthase beta chain